MIGHHCQLPERDGRTRVFTCGECQWVWRLNEPYLHWFRELPAP